MALNSIKAIQRRFRMIYVGIDVAKDKHDCFITDSDGEVLFKSFTISNNREEMCIRDSLYTKSLHPPSCHIL